MNNQQKVNIKNVSVKVVDINKVLQYAKDVLINKEQQSTEDNFIATKVVLKALVDYIEKK